MTIIEGWAFSGCSSLTSINIPNSVKAIESGAFYECSNLISVTIGNSVTNIGHMSFSSCSSLSSINIPNSVKTIESYAFSGCSNLISITIPENLTIIQEGLFKSCSQLKYANLSDSIKIIRKEAFSGCCNLINIVIPKSVEFIYQEAFAGCLSLEIIEAKPLIPPFLYDNAFDNYSIPVKVPKGCKEAYQTAQGWKNFSNIIDTYKYKLTYLVDNEEYKVYEIEEGETIIPEPAPTKEGYTFSGWSEIPETMPEHDVIVTGTFTINTYKLTYTVDGEVYKSYDIEYGATITPETEPAKEGYTFSGWSEIPEKMPAHDVTVTGSFSINKYKLTYIVDGVEYKSFDIEYGATITPEAEPSKEGYTFSGWSEIPATMPAHDVTITGSFTKGAYKLTYMLDGVVYKTISYDYGDAITPEPAPTKEGYTFSGWSEIPETMPAHDVTVTGTFSINKYKLTYTVDGEVYKTYEMEYGATITPEAEPTKEGYTFSGWSEIPETMPAHDVTVTGTFTLDTGIEEIMSNVNGDVMIFTIDGKRVDNLKKGMNIIRMSDGTTRKVVVK